MVNTVPTFVVYLEMLSSSPLSLPSAFSDPFLPPVVPRDTLLLLLQKKYPCEATGYSRDGNSLLSVGGGCRPSTTLSYGV